MTEVRRDSGFTLVELLTVVVILGVLAAISVPTFLNQKQKAAKAAAVSVLHAVSTAQETLVAGDESAGYTEVVAELESVGYNPSDGIVGPVISVNGNQYVACVKPQSVDQWLVLTSSTQRMEWSATNSCV